MIRRPATRIAATCSVLFAALAVAHCGETGAAKKESDAKDTAGGATGAPSGTGAPADTSAPVQATFEKDLNAKGFAAWGGEIDKTWQWEKPTSVFVIQLLSDQMLPVVNGEIYLKRLGSKEEEYKIKDKLKVGNVKSNVFTIMIRAGQAYEVSAFADNYDPVSKPIVFDSAAPVSVAFPILLSPGKKDKKDWGDAPPPDDELKPAVFDRSLKFCDVREKGDDFKEFLEILKKASEDTYLKIEEKFTKNGAVITDCVGTSYPTVVVIFKTKDGLEKFVIDDASFLEDYYYGSKKEPSPDKDADSDDAKLAKLKQRYLEEIVPIFAKACDKCHSKDGNQEPVYNNDDAEYIFGDKGKLLKSLLASVVKGSMPIGGLYELNDKERSIVKSFYADYGTGLSDKKDDGPIDIDVKPEPSAVPSIDEFRYGPAETGSAEQDKLAKGSLASGFVFNRSKNAPSRVATALVDCESPKELAEIFGGPYFNLILANFDKGGAFEGWRIDQCGDCGDNGTNADGKDDALCQEGGKPATGTMIFVVKDGGGANGLKVSLGSFHVPLRPFRDGTGLAQGKHGKGEAREKFAAELGPILGKYCEACHAGFNSYKVADARFADFVNVLAKDELHAGLSKDTEARVLDALQEWDEKGRD